VGFEHTYTSSHAQYKIFEMHYMYATITLEEHLDTNAQQAFRGEVCEDGSHPHSYPTPTRSNAYRSNIPHLPVLTRPR